MKRELSRLVASDELVNLRKGFYLIIPPRYASFKKLPLQLYAEKLFRYLGRNYYIGLYSAARMHGAAHQQSQADYLLIEPPKLNNINKGNIDIRFLTSSSWPKSNLIQKRGDAGNYHLSSASLTFFDLVRYHSKIGGLNRVLSVLEELLEEVDETDLSELLSWYKNRSTLQRSGFLMESLNAPASLTAMVYAQLSRKPFYPNLLSPKAHQKAGSVGNRWKVDVNVNLEIDL